jgi:hypothetical protein
MHVGRQCQDGRPLPPLPLRSATVSARWRAPGPPSFKSADGPQRSTTRRRLTGDLRCGTTPPLCRTGMRAWPDACHTDAAAIIARLSFSSATAASFRRTDRAARQQSDLRCCTEEAVEYGSFMRFAQNNSFNQLRATAHGASQLATPAVQWCSRCSCTPLCTCGPPRPARQPRAPRSRQRGSAHADATT